MKAIFKPIFLLRAVVLLVSILQCKNGVGQVIAWDLTGLNTTAIAAATTYNVNLMSSGLLTRGPAAPASAGNNSFRTVGFKNDGISTSNGDYFQFTLSAATGYVLSLSTIDAFFAGTGTFYASSGVTSQFAYSLDGTNFFLIGSPVTSPATILTQINLNAVTALQNVPAGTTITFRYYASGQTTTGSWGFNSADSGQNGLAIGGALITACTPPSAPAGVIDATSNPSCGSTNLSFPLSGVANVTYYWQTSATGTSITLATNGTANYPVNASGTYFARAYNSVTSCWSTETPPQLSVTVSNPVSVTSQPSSQSVTAPAAAVFNVAVTGTVSTYQWQYYNGSSWINLANTSPYSGVATASLSVNPTVIGLSGMQYRVLINGSAPCTNLISSTATLTVAYGTLSTDYFRSNVTSGNWATPSSWQSTSDNVTWYTATAAPTSAANTIWIRGGNTLVVSTAVSLDQTTINGELQIQNAGSLTINDGAFDDITIASGGVLRTLAQRDYSAEVTYASLANIRVNAGGKITVGNGGGVGGGGYHNFTNGNNIWETAAVYEWNVASTFATSDITYFTNAGASIPIFRVSKVSGTPGAGLNNNTIFNGTLEVNTPLTFIGAGNKTFRDGFFGSSILTLDASLGTTTISSVNAIFGGSLTIIINKNLNLSNGVTVPAGANVLLSSSSTSNITKNGGNVVINGTLDITDRTISNTSGSVIVTGTIKTSKTNGFYSPGNVASGTMIINTGSTIEYNGTTSQTISTGITYANLTFSGSGTKTPSNAINATGTVFITGATIVDFTNYNLTGADFTMNNGRLILGTTGTLPAMTGAYNLTGGIVQFASATNQSIRSKTYQNIEVTGAGVKNSTGNVTLHNLGTFTIKSGGVFEINADAIVGPDGTQTLTVESGGVFKCGNALGFNGPVVGFNSPSVRNDIEIINLNTGSTVNYSRSIPPLSTDAQTITNTIPYHHLYLSGSGIKTAPAGTLIINGDFKNLSDNPTFAHNNGTVLFNGSALQVYHVNYPGFTFYNLTTANPVNLYFGSRASITKQFAISTGAKITLDTSHIVLLSTQYHTANVDKISSVGPIAYAGSGRFIVERFIGTGLTHGKTWQILSVPTHGFNQSVKDAWQEGNMPLSNALNPGYGTTLTSNVANAVSRGFDFYTAPGPSIKTFDPTIADWVGIDNGTLNTNAIPIENKRGYMILVRGDRSVLTSTANANQTIMRTAGKLYAPGNTPPVSTVLAGKFESVGNPYASAIDFKHIEKTAGVDSTFYVWDPLLAGGYGLGAYQTFIYDPGAAAYEPTPGGGSYSGGNNKIESGQAFLIHSTGASNGTITFTENCKVSTSNLVAREQNMFAPSQELSMNLHLVHANSGILLDGTRIQFGRNYSNVIDGMDALKINNAGENISLKISDKNLAVERRGPVSDTDTIFYALTNLRQQHYLLHILPRHMQLNGLKAYLVDQFLQTRTELSLHQESKIPFQVTHVPASSMPNRFYLVFNRGKKINFDYVHFEHDNSNTAAPLAGPLSTISNISVYPNPVRDDKTANIHFRNSLPGNYILTLTSASGIILQKNTIFHSGKNQSVSLPLHQVRMHGNYTLTISNDEHTKTSIKIVY